MSEEPDFKNRDEFDESERELCPDGNCTGLIGADGRCKVCGLALDGSRAGAPYAAAARDHDETPPDEDRQLCPDGNCIGLIGSDGKCKVCGRSAAS